MTEELFQEFVFDADAKTVIDFIVSGSWRIDGGSFAVGETSPGPKMALRDVWTVEGACAFFARLSAANGPRGWGVSLDNVEIADGGQVYIPKRDTRWQPLDVAPLDVRKRLEKRGVTIPKKPGSWRIARADYGGSIAILQQRPGECIARLFVESNPARWNYEKRDWYLPMQKAHEFIGAVWRGIVEGWLSRNSVDAQSETGGKGKAPGRPGLVDVDLVYRLAMAKWGEELKAENARTTWKEICSSIRWRSGYSKSGIKLMEDARARLQRARAGQYGADMMDRVEDRLAQLKQEKEKKKTP